jgi:hypothetical protein
MDLGPKTARDRLTSSAAPTRRPQLVDAANFLLATRDSGYRSTAYAVAEFVDNSLQAGATSVAIHVRRGEENRYPIELLVIDDGAGMDDRTLASALTFGGSSRFGDRSSLGRYGMGLPNGALSCARRVDVFTWQRRRVLTSRLDLDELVSSRRRSLPPVEAIALPPFLPGTPHGTAVLLRRCDRLEYRRPSTLASKLHNDLGRIYRRFIQGGIDLRVNGEAVAAIDPLLLKRNGKRLGARRFGEKLTYQLEGAGGNGAVEVVFTELPVDRWHNLSTEEKRELGVTNAARVSSPRSQWPCALLSDAQGQPSQRERVQRDDDARTGHRDGADLGPQRDADGLEDARCDRDGERVVADGPGEVLAHLSLGAAADLDRGGDVDRVGAHQYDVGGFDRDVGAGSKPSASRSSPRRATTASCARASRSARRTGCPSRSRSLPTRSAGAERRSSNCASSASACSTGPQMPKPADGL